MLLIINVLFTGISGARADSENPFGFETNTHPLEYEYCKKELGLFRNHGHKCNSAPRPHPDLQEYKLQFVEQVGLCYILATSSKRLLDGCLRHPISLLVARGLSLGKELVGNLSIE